MSDLTNSIDQEMENVWLPIIENNQTAYFLTNGQYAQLKWSHSTPPEDGISVVPDNLQDSVTDFPAFFTDFYDVTNVEMRARIKINIYSTPSGEGYSVVMDLIENGNRYIKSIGYGPYASEYSTKDPETDKIIWVQIPVNLNL